MSSVWQVAETGCGLWQQLCAGWGEAVPASISGQEKQLPRNNASTASEASSEMENFLTKP